jgi:hypothetical protein
LYPPVPGFLSLSLPTAPHHGRKKIIAAQKKNSRNRASQEKIISLNDYRK